MSTKVAFAGIRPPRPRPQRKAKDEPDTPPPVDEMPRYLPAEMVQLVFANLEVPDLAAASQVSREWRAVSCSCDAAWQRAFEEEFGASKAPDFAHLHTWRDRYIACRLDTVFHKLRCKARYLDELEDSSTLLERNAQKSLTTLHQMDRTLSHRRHDLNVLLASLAGKPGTHADSRRGKELLELAQRGGDLAAAPRLTPDSCDALREMQRDVEFWKGSIAEERDSLHRMWDSLSYVSNCCAKARADIAALQKRKAALEAATRWRPTVRRS